MRSRIGIIAGRTYRVIQDQGGVRIMASRRQQLGEIPVDFHPNTNGYDLQGLETETSWESFCYSIDGNGKSEKSCSHAVNERPCSGNFSMESLTIITFR